MLLNLMIMRKRNEKVSIKNHVIQKLTIDDYKKNLFTEEKQMRDQYY